MFSRVDGHVVWNADTGQPIGQPLTGHTDMSHKQWREWVSPDIDYIKACPDLPVAPD
jgi:hypothetical protein